MSVALRVAQTCWPAARARSATAAGVTSATRGMGPPRATRTRSPTASRSSTGDGPGVAGAAVGAGAVEGDGVGGDGHQDGPAAGTWPSPARPRSPGVTMAPSAWPSRRFKPTRRATKADRGRRVISAGVPDLADPPVLQDHQPVGQRASASTGSWDTRTIARSARRSSVRSSRRTRARPSWSRAARGSSRRRTSGLARPAPGRWRPAGPGRRTRPADGHGPGPRPRASPARPTAVVAGGVLRHARGAEAEGHVVPQVEVGEQRRVLEHQPGRSLVGRHEHVADRIVDHPVAEAQGALVQRGQAGQDPQQRALARPVLAQHPDDLARLDPQVQLGREVAPRVTPALRAITTQPPATEAVPEQHEHEQGDEQQHHATGRGRPPGRSGGRCRRRGAGCGSGPRTLPAKVMVAPNSPRARAKARAAPAASCGARRGTVTRQNVAARLAPRVRAASS